VCRVHTWQCEPWQTQMAKNCVVAKALISKSVPRTYVAMRTLANRNGSKNAWWKRLQNHNAKLTLRTWTLRTTSSSGQDIALWPQNPSSPLGEDTLAKIAFHRGLYKPTLAMYNRQTHAHVQWHCPCLLPTFKTIPWQPQMLLKYAYYQEMDLANVNALG